MNDNLLARRNFSKASKDYDRFSFIQRKIADELLNRIKFMYMSKSILDIGMGTGYLLQKIRSLYPDLKLFGLDYALGMIEIAKKINGQDYYLQADARKLPFINNAFDMVISNVSYQWVRDLNIALCEVRRILGEKGRFCFSVFCEKTLNELRGIVKNLSSDREMNPLGEMPNKEEVEKALKEAGFSNIRTEFVNFKHYYQNIYELLIWLKNIGANRFWSGVLYRGLSARRFINAVDTEYENRFKENEKIFATFEVLFVEAIK